MHLRINPPTTRTPSNRASQCFLALFLVLLFSGAVHAATTWFVDADRPDDSGDGLSWETAKKSIQAAVDAAAEDDHIWVADGNYAPFIADVRHHHLRRSMTLNRPSLTATTQNAAQSWERSSLLAAPS